MVPVREVSFSVADEVNPDRHCPGCTDGCDPVVWDTGTGSSAGWFRSGYASRGRVITRHLAAVAARRAADHGQWPVLEPGKLHAHGGRRSRRNRVFRPAPSWIRPGPAIG